MSLSRSKPLQILVVLVCVAVSFWASQGSSDEAQDRRPAPRAGSADALVTRVVDGDTAEMKLSRGDTESVRYIGVDTPESVAPGQPVECFGKEASEFNRRLVEGEDVTLRFGAERRDRYGRLLAYVYLGDNFVNATLVKRGFAQTLEIEPNTDFAARFANLQQVAANAGRGLWSAC